MPITQSSGDAAVIRIAVVEDDARLRGSLVRLIATQPNLSFQGAFASSEEILAHSAAATSEVVLMDINLPGLSGIECVSALKALNPRLQIMMLTVYDDSDRILAALKAGATGYLLKRTEPEELFEAVRNLHEGGSPMSSSIARKVVLSLGNRGASSAKDASHGAALTAREREILDALALGLQNKEIADKHGISITTVRAHLRNIYEKLQVQNRTEAVIKRMSGSPSR